MEKDRLTVWYDDELGELLERLALVLIEVGVVMKKVERGDGFVTYEFFKAELLEE